MCMWGGDVVIVYFGQITAFCLDLSIGKDERGKWTTAVLRFHGLVHETAREART